MRLPRVRFTVGTLLLAVAVVAANCWAFRCFYGRVRWLGVMGRLLDIRIGVLPLANVALIGAVLVVVRGLRSLRRGRAANPRSSAPGVAYFSLNFLALVVFVYFFMPDAMRITVAVLDVVTEYAARGWAAVFGAPEETVPWLIAQSAILGVCLSGPPLLLTWIGQSLATRCAATLPRRRFRAMACLVSLDFAGTALAICLVPWPSVDEQDVALDFQVVDEDSGRPIAQVFLCLTNPFARDGELSSKAFTDADGHARLTGHFDARGERNAFRFMGDFSPWGRWLEASAEGYRTRHTSLTESLGPSADPARLGLCKVILARGETGKDTFRDIAGTYRTASNGFTGSSFEIEPDGRFTWGFWSCTSTRREYGYLKRHGEEIEPVPIPRPGRGAGFGVTSRYRVIGWGDHLYLTLADEHGLRDICRTALAPYLPLSSAGTYRIYHRESGRDESDRDRPETGLPRLPPGVWAKFLADEVSLRNAEGSLRLALDRLVSQVARLRVAGMPSPQPRADDWETAFAELVSRVR